MKIIDQIYCCPIPSQISGLWQLQCHLRIFQPPNKTQIVMLTNLKFETEMGFEMDWFIPQIIETLGSFIVREFNLEPARVVWIEHYTSDFKPSGRADCNQVTFEWQNGLAANPQWSQIAPETAQMLMSEDLIPA